MFVFSCSNTGSMAVGQDAMYLVDATGAAITQTLPDATLCKGQLFVIQKVDVTANSVTINTVSSQNISNGVLSNTSLVLSSVGATVSLVSNGTGYTVTHTPAQSTAALAQLFPKSRVAVSKLRRNLADFNIICLGDSTTWGVASTGSNIPSVSGYPAILANEIGAALRNVPSVNGLVIPTSTIGGAGVNVDSRWGIPGNWSNTSYGYGAAGYVTTGSGAALTFTPGTMSDTYDIDLLQFSGGGICNIQATGGTATTGINLAGSQAIRKITVTAGSASTSNVVTITPTSGQIFVTAAMARLASTKQVLVGNCGVPSLSALVATTPTGGLSAFSTMSQLQADAPDLTIIMLGVNDARDSNSVSTYLTAMQTLITAAQTTGDCMIMTVFPSITGDSHYTYEHMYYQPLLALAAQNNCPVFDMWARLGGVYNSTFMYVDGIHGNDYGYGDAASGIAALLGSVL